MQREPRRVRRIAQWHVGGTAQHLVQTEKGQMIAADI
jgi:hypothetical protein